MIAKPGNLSTGTLVSSLNQKHSLIKDHISMSFSSLLKLQTLISEYLKLSYFFFDEEIFKIRISYTSLKVLS